MHTPGPWEHDMLRVWAYAGDSEDPDSDPLYIASLKFRDDTNVDGDQAWANANLIAAAPDLLKALQDIVTHVTFVAGTDLAMMSSTIAIAQKAIDKATKEDH